MNNTRGAIRNREASNAVKDYTKLRWRNITPTDIDGAIDFGNKLFIFIELKRKGQKLEGGQRLFLEREVDSHKQRCYCIVAEYDTDGDIVVDICVVSEMRHNKQQPCAQWQIAREGITVKAMIDRVLEKYAPEYLK